MQQEDSKHCRDKDQTEQKKHREQGERDYQRRKQRQVPEESWKVEERRERLFEPC